ncbi:MAG: hypothetical protein E2577_17080, partial [Starkeya sp.]|nr:hypothetical protein [Starkeya sp.]
QDEGAMLTVRVNGVEAYAATADLSQAGLQRALSWAATAAPEPQDAIANKGKGRPVTRAALFISPRRSVMMTADGRPLISSRRDRRAPGAHAAPALRSTVSRSDGPQGA